MDLTEFFQTPLGRFLCAMFGAFVLYALNLLNNRQPFSLFRVLQVSMDARPWVTLVDMLISSAMGAGVVFLIVYPTSASEAGTAGLGLTGILSAFGKDARRR
jgi:hypothetical protein